MTSISELDVLVVDDEPTFLEFIETMLTAIGVARVRRAGSGSQAAAVLAAPDCSVNCVLCDIAMAQGNGLELLVAVRTDRSGRFRTNLSFILVTAMEDDAIREKARVLGASGFLLKPVTSERLLDAIKPNRIVDVFQPRRRMLER